MRFQSGSIDLYSGTASNNAGDAVTPTGTVTLSDASGSLWLWVSGTAGKVGGGDWANSSDCRLKNIGDDYTAGLAELTQLQPKKYTVNGKGGLKASDQEYVGVIAQEVVELSLIHISEPTRPY